MMSEYPEHDKLKSVAKESAAIGEFLDNSRYILGVFLWAAPAPDDPKEKQIGARVAILSILWPIPTAWLLYLLFKDAFS